MGLERLGRLVSPMRLKESTLGSAATHMSPLDLVEFPRRKKTEISLVLPAYGVETGQLPLESAYSAKF